MKICLITKEFYPIYAGAAERYRRYALKLKNYGVFFRVVTFKTDSLSNFEIINGMEVIRINKKNRVNITNYMISQCFRYDNSIEIIQFLNLPSLLPPISCKLEFSGRPCLYTHTLNVAPQKNDFKKLFFKIHKYITYRSFDGIITLSTYMKQQLRTYGVPDSKIYVIPNGVDTLRFSPPNTEAEKIFIKRKLGFSSNDIIVIFIGALHPRKGVDVLISAWDKVITSIKNAKLLLIGPPSSKHMEYYHKLISSIKRLSNPASVVLKRRVENVEEYLKMSDIFVFPSHREGLPNVVLEAMSTGLPCILAPFIGLSTEIGRPNEEFFLVDRSPATFAGAILELIENKNLRKELGKNAREWAVKYLDLNKTILQLYNLYHFLSKNYNNKNDIS